MRGAVIMEFYKIENLWLCKLAAVSRQEDDQRMILYEDESKTFLLLWKEENEGSKRVVDFKKYCQRKGPEYCNFSGQEFYHGTQKTVFRPDDIDKIFVISRIAVPSKFLSTDEIRQGIISKERIIELSHTLSSYKFGT